MYTGLGIEYVRVIGFGKEFEARFGELKDKIVRAIILELVHKKDRAIVISEAIQFNGIKTYVPLDNSEFELNCTFKINHPLISKHFGIDIWGTATLNYLHLKKVDPALIPEDEKSNSSPQNEELWKTLRPAFEDVNKRYKYNTIKRYLDDKILREKYKSELNNIDNVYRGPGSKYKFVDLKAEFEK